MPRAILLIPALLAAASANSATLTITPDQPTYRIDETITLNVLGDPEGGRASVVVGTILFDADLAAFVRSSQEQLTSFDGVLPWATNRLEGGDGFADAFAQLCCDTPRMVDSPLVATVILQATAPGELVYGWQSDLTFFGLQSAPGGSVTIVPEPSTSALLAVGMLGLALRSRRVGRSLRAGSPGRWHGRAMWRTPPPPADANWRRIACDAS